MVYCCSILKMSSQNINFILKTKFYSVQEIINESQCSDDSNEKQEDSGLNSPNSSSSEEHVNKKMKTSSSGSSTEVDSE